MKGVMLCYAVDTPRTIFENIFWVFQEFNFAPQAWLCEVLVSSVYTIIIIKDKILCVLRVEIYKQNKLVYFYFERS